MTPRLVAEFQRLYQLPGEPPPFSGSALRLVGPSRTVRTLVLGLCGPADWSKLSVVWRGVQMDLDLPAPAIAVNGVDAYELWFSLAQPVPLTQAGLFLEGLRQRYLPDLKAARVVMRPSMGAQDEAQNIAIIPSPQGDSGNWSAFVAPDLAAVFGEEPVLDLAPGEDAQAELLCRLVCIRPTEFEAALVELQAAPSPIRAVQAPLVPALPVESHQEDARRFLRSVMGDASVPIASRIEAAKALLLG